MIVDRSLGFCIVSTIGSTKHRSQDGRNANIPPRLSALYLAVVWYVCEITCVLSLLVITYLHTVYSSHTRIFLASL